jgi:hypothetical protein
VKTQLLSTRIQETISGEAPTPSSSEISDYYDAAKGAQYTTAESRDVRVVVNKDKAKIEAAKAALEKDDSPASWKEVAAKYSEDPTTKSKGGLQPALTEELLASQEGLKSAIFGNPTGVIAGPVDIEGKLFLVEVQKLNPQKVKALPEVSAEIKTQLTQQVTQEAFSEFVAEWQSKWSSRTFCADGYEIERCANYPPAKRVEKEREQYKSCYEADPKEPAKECPAPVAQTKPALPGSVTILKPGGEPLPQGPRPVGLKEGAESALPEGVPGTTSVPPPTGE